MVCPPKNGDIPKREISVFRGSVFYFTDRIFSRLLNKSLCSDFGYTLEMLHHNYKGNNFCLGSYTVELQWLEDLWDHGNLFEPLRVNHGTSSGSK